ncbi:MAG: hypothetical protein M1550_00875 [Deltaproteobacteria bacterium]|nr:hypothetical protein [Deltaproteobacteria bacterium]
MDSLGQDFFDLAREVMRSRGNGKHVWKRRDLEVIAAGLEAARPCCTKQAALS